MKPHIMNIKASESSEPTRNIHSVIPMRQKKKKLREYELMKQNFAVCVFFWHFNAENLINLS